MTTKYRIRRIKTCADCSHHISIHQYDPAAPHAGPQKCQVPECKCRAHRRPEPFERIKRAA